MQTDYEYRGLLAASWDLFRGDTSTWEDKFFYQDLIRQYGQPVLDVGCGTGRLLLDFLDQGIDIDGVDNSPEMLALCRQKAAGLGLEPTIYETWMETLDLPRRYRTIMVPSSSFQLVVEPPKAAMAMRRLYAHLEPGGALIMPFMVLRAPGTASETTDWRLTGEKERPEDGTLLKRWSRARYDVENQLEHTEDRYELSLNTTSVPPRCAGTRRPRRPHFIKKQAFRRSSCLKSSPTTLPCRMIRCSAWWGLSRGRTIKLWALR